jgi:hypothetical protein
VWGELEIEASTIQAQEEKTMKIKERALEILGKGLVVGFVMHGCVLGSLGTSFALNPEAQVLAGMDALAGELGWVSETVEIAPLDRSEEYVVLTVPPLVNYKNSAANPDSPEEDLEAYVE